MVCLWNSIQEVIASNVDIVHYFSIIIWSLNVLLFIFFIIELVLREVKWFKLPHAYLMVICSMISSIISSTFFLLSQNNLLSINNICLFGPIIGLSFRSIAKHFTWALYIIRGQMVMESTNKCSQIIAQKAPYMLLIQCILITSLIIIFTETETNNATNKCAVSFPLWLLICSALLGELFYGLGFMNVFYRAMTTSMEHVYNSVNKKAAMSIKRQIRHHIIVYSVQLISSLIFLFIVSLCICFNTLVFFETELFISNLCLLLLFRKKNKVFSKLLCCFKDARNIANHLTMVSNNINASKTGINSSKTDLQTRSQITSTNTIGKHIANPSIHQFVETNVNSENFLSNNWKTNETIHNIKSALKLSQAAPKLNAKALEMLGVSTIKNINKSSPLPTNINKTPDSDEPSIEIIIDETDENINTELNIPNINKFRQSTSGILTRIYDNENINVENDIKLPEFPDINDIPICTLNKSQSLIAMIDNNNNNNNNNENEIRLPKLGNLATKSEPLWTINFKNGQQKDLESSPSVHLLEDLDVDFMERNNNNNNNSPKSLSSFTNAFVNKLKNKINNNNKRKQSDSKSKSKSKPKTECD